MKTLIGRQRTVAVAGVIALVGAANWVSVASAVAQDIQGGIEVDQSVVQMHNLAPGKSQDGYVQLTNTSNKMLFITAVTVKSQDIEGVKLQYEACSVPWVDGACAAETLTVADYDLTTLPTQVKTLDYALRAGHTSYFKLVASMQGAGSQRGARSQTQIVFKWVAQQDPPVGVEVVAMPSSGEDEVVVPVDLEEDDVIADPVPELVAVDEPQSQPVREVVQKVLAETGASATLAGLCATAGLLVAAGTASMVRARRRDEV